MTGAQVIGVAALSGLVGGIGALCIRLITPGQTFLKPPEGLSGLWKGVIGFLTYTSDLILGAIAGVVAIPIAGVGSQDLLRLVAVGAIAGVGGAGFLTNLSTKFQAESNAAKLYQNQQVIGNQAENIMTKLESTRRNAGGSPLAPQLDQLSGQVEQLQATIRTPPV